MSLCHTRGTSERDIGEGHLRGTSAGFSGHLRVLTSWSAGVGLIGNYLYQLWVCCCRYGLHCVVCVEWPPLFLFLETLTPVASKGLGILHILWPPLHLSVLCGEDLFLEVVPKRQTDNAIVSVLPLTHSLVYSPLTPFLGH